MQRFHAALAVALTAALLLCPFLCGPGEASCACRCEGGDEQAPCNSPAPCNGSGDSCICHGATPLSATTTAPLRVVADQLLNLFLPVAHVQRPALAERVGPSSLRAPRASPSGTALRILVQSLLS